MADARPNSPSLGVIVVAAGSSTRMGGGDKQFADLNGVPVLGYSLKTFAGSKHVSGIAVVLSSDNLERGRGYVSEAGLDDLVICVQGGERRQDSARIGLETLRSSAPESEIIAVHDGARPFVDEPMIERGLAAVRVTGAAVAAVPVKDTIKASGSDRVVTKTLDRSGLWAIQTPQVFNTEVLSAAYQSVTDDVTDDASMVELAGGLVAVFDGHPENIKITTPDDLLVAGLIASRRQGVEPSTGEQRWGTGFDGHKLAAGGPLRLGGVDVPFDHHLEGHSDGDVLLHAISSSILGAASLGDLGSVFPSSDQQLAGIDSGVILAECVRMAFADGWVVTHLDATIVAQRPKLAGHLSEMANQVAKIAEIPHSSVNIKVTSTDGVGAIGVGEGIAAQAIATLSRRS